MRSFAAANLLLDFLVLVLVLFKILLPDAVRLTCDSEDLADVAPRCDVVGVFIEVIP